MANGRGMHRIPKQELIRIAARCQEGLSNIGKPKLRRVRSHRLERREGVHSDG